MIYDTAPGFEKIKISEAVKAKNGYRVIVGHYWIVTPENEILIYRGNSIQANVDSRISEKIRNSMYPGCEVRRISKVYVQLN